MTLPGVDPDWRNGPFDECPYDDFLERLQIACNHIETGTLRAEGAGQIPFRKVALTEFSEWALAPPRNWCLPEQFPRNPGRTATAPGAAEARMPRPVERRSRKGGKNPGDGARNDDPYLIEMVHVIAENKATSPNAAARQIAKANNEPAENAHRRLSAKFIKRYGSNRRGREPWGDVCRRIADELQTK
jgi:hypothetical protein